MFHTIFCDMDGLLSDFHLEAIRAHMRVGRHFPALQHFGTPLQLNQQKVLRLWQRGLSLQKWLDIRPDKFWGPIREDVMFWHNLPIYPWAKDLIALLKTKCHNLALVTHADHTPQCHSGKRQWLANYGFADLEYIAMSGNEEKPTARKWRLVAPDCLLIDDFDKTIQGWKRECRYRYSQDGHAILFPAPWNINYPFSNDPLAYVQNWFTEFEANMFKDADNR